MDSDDERDEEAEFLAYMQGNDAETSEASGESVSEGEEEDGSEDASESESEASLQSTDSPPPPPQPPVSPPPPPPLDTESLQEEEQWRVEMRDALADNTNRYFAGEDAFTGKKCSFCRKPGHLPRDCKEKECPHFWRNYKLKPTTSNTTANLPPIRMFCYNCSSNKHFGDDCTSANSRAGYGYNITGFNIDSVMNAWTGNAATAGGSAGSSSGSARRGEHLVFEEGRGVSKKEREEIRSYESDRYSDRNGGGRNEGGGGRNGGGGYNSNNNNITNLSREDSRGSSKGKWDDGGRRSSTKSSYLDRDRDWDRRDSPGGYRRNQIRDDYYDDYEDFSASYKTNGGGGNGGGGFDRSRNDRSGSRGRGGGGGGGNYANFPKHIESPRRQGEGGTPKNNKRARYN
ncbi:hypothetical protein HDU98_005170 [Podochytrium sp. JEL0797]|nr:hypothetical protein HDU98_005170 [Podochytrium sp. JEL0797]